MAIASFPGMSMQGMTGKWGGLSSHGPIMQRKTSVAFAFDTSGGRKHTSGRAI